MSDPAAPDLPPVLGWTELTETLRLSKTRLRQLEDAGTLPAPIASLRMGRVWSTEDVRRWCAQQGRVMYPLLTADSDRQSREAQG